MGFVFVLLVLPLLGGSTVCGHNGTHYTAAVVEYSPRLDANMSGEEVVIVNIAFYEEIIRSASLQGADILVFPEAGLTGVFTNKSVFYSQVPHPRQSACPCLQPSNWSIPLIRLSCAARSNRVYVAVNLNEKDGHNRYNAAVVFDRYGIVVSRYRKIHLFGESNLQVPEDSDYGVFQTDFGVTFGLAICFDLLFEEPAQKLIKTQNIRHFIFPIAWFSEHPLLMATQIQAAWAWSQNAVLLASGLNEPSKGCTGSGIYAGRRGAIKTFFTGKNTTQLLIAAVPKSLDVKAAPFMQPFLERDDFDSIVRQELYLLRDHLSAFSTLLLPDTTPSFNRTLCHGEFCCHFNVDTEYRSMEGGWLSDFERKQSSHCQLDTCLRTTGNAGPQSITYRLFAWDGVRDCSGVATLGVQTCGIMACRKADDVTSCGLPVPRKQFPRKTSFSKLQISGVFRQDNTMILANTLNQNLSPFRGDFYDLQENTNECKENSCQDRCVTLKLLREQNELQTFAIYNRVFERDGSNFTQESNTDHIFSKFS